MTTASSTKTNWKIRRTVMFIITVFCMVIIWRGMAMPGETASMSVRYSFYIIASVMVVYVFGVIVDDHVETWIKAKYGVRND